MSIFSGEDITVLMAIYAKTNIRYFKESLLSITNSQTTLPKQVVLVIDGPLSDNKLNEVQDVIKMIEVPVELLSTPANQGLSAALNYGLSRITTPLIARMDDDDISVPERLQIQLDAFNKEENLAVHGGGIIEFSNEVGDGKNARILPEGHNDIIKFSKYRSPFNHPTVMMKADTLNRAEGYLPMGNFEDYYLWVRVLSIPDVVVSNTSEILVYMRAGEGLYQRRGNLNYLKSMIRLRNWMLTNMKINIFEYLFGVIGHGLTIMLPPSFREQIYGALFRKKQP